jgi:hypothetical protein
MRRLAIAFILAASVTRTAASDESEKAAVLAPLHQFVTAMNKGDKETAIAACAIPASIIDEIPPHEWQGATACADWMNDLDANLKKDEDTDLMQELGKPRAVDVNGDRAFAIVPVTNAFKEKGKQIIEPGVLTVAFRKFETGWRITGWAFTRH